jgi:glutathione S-transferase
MPRPPEQSRTGEEPIQMKLFTFATSPYARKVQMMLDYKGIAYEACERCYSLDRKEDLRSVNQRAEVPTLVLDDGRVITDSTIIGEYLEDAFPNQPLFPPDPYERARMRQIDDLCDRGFDAVAFGYFFAELRANANMKQAAVSELRAMLAVLERELGGRSFFCGDLSMADFAAVCHVPLARVMGLGLDEFPRLAEWMVRMNSTPAVRDDHARLTKAVAKARGIADEFEGPDGRIHWRDSRLEWPIRHGFIEVVAREYHAGKMMFPPDAS